DQAYRNGNKPVADQAYGNGNNPVADQAYGNGNNPVAGQAYGNGNNLGGDENNGPISTYAGSHPDNNDISSLINQIFATMYW
ncbi:MAG: hypothetical protein WB988_06230, partial [Candidatus Nitrosopolaris sp.]